MARLSKAHESGRQRVLALAGAGLAPEAFGERLLAILREAVPHDGARLFTVDPSTLLLNRLIAASEGDAPCRLRWLREIYLTAPGVPYLAPHVVMRAETVAILYRSRQDQMPVLPDAFREWVSPDDHSRVFHETQTPAGGSLRLCIRAEGRWLGMLDVVRREPGRPLGPTEFAFLQLVVPAIGRGLAAALARERALDDAGRPVDGLAGDRPDRTPSVDASGVVVLLPGGRIGYATPAGEAWLQRLCDADRAGHGPLPTAVWAAVAGLRADELAEIGSAVVAPSTAGPVRVEASHGGADGTVAIILSPVRPPAAPAVPDHWPLTTQERRVVELLVAGLSNRRLAERLSVSDNTVETHLRHVYAKLDVRTRQELVARLFREAYLPLFAADEARTHG